MSVGGRSCGSLMAMDTASRESLVQALGDEEDVVAAWVYGSVASGSAQPSSDLDLAIVGTQPFTIERLVDLATLVGRVAGREIDIVDLFAVHGALLEQVMIRGTRLFCRQTSVYEALVVRLVYDEADFMPLYRRLLRERRDAFLHD